MEPSSPINGYISFTIEKESGCVDGGASGNLAEIVESIEGGAISGLAYFELLSFGEEIIALFELGRVRKAIDTSKIEFGDNILANKLLEIVYIFLVVEFAHLLFGGLACMIDIHFSV